ncbi:EI24 domain-containing protein [Ruegeria arenilitoris]|uniref:EI24 domain-containing protein n=1 Tax=Ruegeria arenilitoris TaxID=1173585 RepID=UPI001C942E17|nr:EI24 domain-containing protein [Ruegeria arenilitoris]MBY6082457.1 EI24 domain-containing protein [Ruegeria arenilitoris]
MIILNAFFAALGQLGDARFRSVLLRGVGLTIVLLVVACVLAIWGINALAGHEISLPFVGDVPWLNDVLNYSGIFLVLILPVFLMVPVASAITSMFLDEVAQAVEDRHYPNLPPVPSVPIWDALLDSLGFLGVLIVANVMALVLYALFTPLAPFIFWGMNGFLLGREYFTLAAMRRIGRDGARALRARHAGTIWVAGTLMAIPLSIPLVNLVIPIIGAATFTHIYHGLSRQPER